jgi:hypothetical protein
VVAVVLVRTERLLVRTARIERLLARAARTERLLVRTERLLGRTADLFAAVL